LSPVYEVWVGEGGGGAAGGGRFSGLSAHSGDAAGQSQGGQLCVAVGFAHPGGRVSCGDGWSSPPAAGAWRRKRDHQWTINMRNIV